MPVQVNNVFSFAWGLVPLPEGETPMSTYSYTIRIQEQDSNGVIGCQANQTQAIPLSQNVSGDQTYLIPAGATDFPLPLPNNYADFIALFPVGEITVKINSVASTPETIRAGGVKVLDGKNVTAVFVSNSATSETNVRFMQATR